MMMNSRRRLVVALVGALLVLSLGLSVGCGQRVSGIELISYKDPYFPEPYTVVFDECAYRQDADGDLHIVGRTSVEPDDYQAGSLTQLIYVHVFWQPKPGVTFANATTTTAIIRYVIVSAEGTTTYSGTGFTCPKGRRGRKLKVPIETANLRLESHFGDAPELLGDARLSGVLWAEENAHAAVDLMRTLELHAGREREP